MPKKVDVEKGILTLLKNAKFGYSVSKLSQELGISRTTASKYLLKLEQKQKVFVQNIGQYRLWHHFQGFYKETDQCSMANLFFQPFYKSLMKNLPSYDLDGAQLRDLGGKISKDLELSELSEKYLELSTSSVDPSKFVDLKALANVNMSIIESILVGVDSFTWGAPFIFEAENFFILRMVDSKFITTPAHFYLISGIIQVQIQKFANIDIDVHQILQEEKIVDFKYLILN